MRDPKRERLHEKRYHASMTGDALIKRLERIRARVTGTQILSLAELRRIARFELVPLLKESEATAEEYHQRTAYAETIPIKARSDDPTFHRLHIKHFEKLMRSAERHPEQINENDYDEEVIDCRTAIEDVCTEMLLFLEAQPKTRGKQSKARIKGDDRLFYNETEHILP
ncbi:hypothetical protein HY478_03005, partial [Candidatus Uhrbacteria bacterium]|nr:hypothetical protein [Candidatus Uhrbacteria bacterium]